MTESSQIYVREGLSPGISERFSAAPSRIPTHLHDAYRRILEITRRDPLFGAAWKLGGTTAATRAAFGVQKVYFGCLHEREVVHEPRALATHHLCETKGEVEIALRLSRMVHDIKIDDLRSLRRAPHYLQNTLTDAWCIALEMPASAIINLPHAGVTALVADRCAAGCLVLGPQQPINDDPWLDRRPITLERGEVVVARGDVTKLLATPIESTIDFCIEALAEGFTVSPGQWVSTGGLTSCAPLPRRGNVKVRLGETVMLNFDLQA